MGNQDLLSETETMFKRFGDEQSTLLDQHERLSFEVHLNKAMQLSRSLSEPAVARCAPLPNQQVYWKPRPAAAKRGGYSSGFKKAMRKLLGPILGNKAPKDGPAPIPIKDPILWRTFTRSLRV